MSTTDLTHRAHVADNVLRLRTLRTPKEQLHSAGTALDLAKSILVEVQKQNPGGEEESFHLDAVAALQARHDALLFEMTGVRADKMRERLG